VTYSQARNTEWRRERMKDPEFRARTYARSNARKKERYATDPVFRAKRIVAAAEWARKNPEKNRALRLKMEWKQRGIPTPTRPCPERCEACGDLPGKSALHNDHNHLTGTFRGWLCVRCNHALGLLKDSPERCLALARYARAESLQ
jgi:Recombination endonuclease VII